MDNGTKVKNNSVSDNSPHKRKISGISVKPVLTKEPIIPQSLYKSGKQSEREIKSSSKVYSPNKNKYLEKHEKFVSPSSSRIRRSKSSEERTGDDPEIIEPILNFKLIKKPAKPVSIEKIQENFAGNLQETIIAREELKKSEKVEDKKMDKKVISSPSKNIPSKNNPPVRNLRNLKSPSDKTPIMVNGRVLEREELSPIKIYEESIMEKINNFAEQKIMASEPSKEIDLVKEVMEESRIYQESKRNSRTLRTSNESKLYSSGESLSSKSSSESFRISKSSSGLSEELFSKATNSKNSSGLPLFKKSSEQRSSNSRNLGLRSSDQKSSEQKSSEQKSSNSRNLGLKSSDQKSLNTEKKVWKVSGTGKRLSSSNRLKHKDNFAFKTFDEKKRKFCSS